MSSVEDGIPTTSLTHSMQHASTEDWRIRLNSTTASDCIPVDLSKMEFLPWNNPDNIVSAEAETIVRQSKNVLLVLLFLIGGPANVINMAVFYKHGLRDRVNLCLFALSLADELYLLNAVIHDGEQIYIQFTTKEIFGPVARTLGNLNLVFLLQFHYVSGVMSAIIALERCLCVYYPIKFQTILKTKTMAVIIVVVSVVIMGLAFLAAFKYRTGCIYDVFTGMTMIAGVDGKVYKSLKGIIDPIESLFFGVGLSGVVMITVVVSTIMTVVKLRHIAKWRSESSSSLSTQELALTKILVVNSVFFVICLLPNALLRFSWLFLPEVKGGRRNQNIYFMGIWIEGMFSYINSTFNIFVYYLMGSRFRETFWALCGRKVQSGK